MNAEASFPSAAGRPIGVVDVVRYFGRDIRKRWKPLAGGSGFGVMYALARVAEPWPLKLVFDHVLLVRPGAEPPAIAPFGASPYALLATAGLLLAVAGAARGFSYYYQDYLLSTAAQEIVFSIRSRLYRHLHGLPLSFHHQRKAGETLVRLNSDILLLRDMLVGAIVNVGTAVTMIVAMVVVMLLIDPVLTVVALLVMPAVLYFSVTYSARIRSNSRRQRKREGEIAAAMHEALSAIPVIQLHGARDREQERFQHMNRRSLKQGVKATRLEAEMNRAVELALACGLVVVLTVGTLRALQHAITPGDLVVFVSYLHGAYRPLRRASKTVQRSAKALAAAERVIEILDTQSELSDSSDARPAPRFTGRIAFHDVQFAYRPGELALEGISFTIEPGARVVIRGPSGSGKSTLLSLIPRLIDPSAGYVSIDGTDIRAYTLDSLRAQISVVLQDSVLFGLSIADNIRYGRPEASDDEIVAAAHAVGLQEFVASLPDAYNTIVSERGTSLSGGQRQRIALARALIRRTPILLLDEPTTGLDDAARHHVIATLRALRGATIVIATHDDEVAHEADQVIVLDHGHITSAREAELSSSSAQVADVRAENGAGPDSHLRPTPDGAPAPLDLLGEPGPPHLLAVPMDSGDSLFIERTGPTPAVGAVVSIHAANGRRWFVREVAHSPLPGDVRICAYLQALDGPEVPGAR